MPSNGLRAFRLRRRRSGRARGGLVLLEVVVSLGILVLAMGVIGVAFNNGARLIERAEQKTQAVIMTERLIAEIDTKLVDLSETSQSGDFHSDEYELDETLPDMHWRIEVNDSRRVEELLEIDIYITMKAYDDPDMLPVLQTRIYRPEPRGFNFKRDFGLDDDQIQQITDLVPGGAQMFDPDDFDPAEMMSNLSLDELVDLLPVLMQMLGGTTGEGQLDQLIRAAESGDLSSLQNAAQQQGVNLPSSGGGQ